MKSLLTASIPVLALLAAPTHAETVALDGATPHDGSADLDPPRSADEPRDNTLSLQAGLMPSFTLLGVEYVRTFHPHFELAMSAGVGLTVQVAVIPRVRWAHGPWRVAAGVGPSLGWLVLDPSFGDRAMGIDKLLPAAVGEATVSYVTRRGLAIQAAAGYSAFCDGHESPLDCSSVGGMPIAALGIGWTW